MHASTTIDVVLAASDVEVREMIDELKKNFDQMINESLEKHNIVVNSLGSIACIRALYSGPLGSIAPVKKIHHVCIRLPRKPFAYKWK